MEQRGEIPLYFVLKKDHVEPEEVSEGATWLTGGQIPSKHKAHGLESIWYVEGEQGCYGLKCAPPKKSVS